MESVNLLSNQLLLTQKLHGLKLICICMYLVWLTFSEMQNITLMGYKNEISMFDMFSWILDGIQSCPKAFPKASNLF